MKRSLDIQKYTKATKQILTEKSAPNFKSAPKIAPLIWYYMTLSDFDWITDGNKKTLRFRREFNFIVSRNGQIWTGDPLTPSQVGYYSLSSSIKRSICKVPQLSVPLIIIIGIYYSIV